jgi:hypothetical protein
LRRLPVVFAVARQPAFLLFILFLVAGAFARAGDVAAGLARASLARANLAN